ncbi:MAG: hypothetical protein WCY97_05995 [Methanothrix sp.]|jgi:hypothetical protein|nr:hypothetical protein [Methanothrix harundinacea]MDD2637480.1 hypothetical protein [Methanothrix sp.]MDD3709170.1 hypothetical protein [Methanothrix sp.]MDD5767874.1 hypothetical protein [Methanothrix sp.]MDI9400018.1 hypothetical protein [Euryarchaeota archaeon]
MTANNFANHLDGYISRILSGFKPSKPEIGSFSRGKDISGSSKMIEQAITKIAPLFRRGEANV